MPEQRGELETWCCGLPLVEGRALSEEERRDLARRLRWLRFSVYGSWFGVFALIPLPLLLSCLLRTSQGLHPASFGFCMLGCCVVYPFFFISKRDSIRKALLENALKTDRVERFKGVFPKAVNDPVVAWLIEKSLLATEDDSEHSLEILAGPKLILSVDGKRPDSYYILPSGKIAPSAYKRMGIRLRRIESQTVPNSFVILERRHMTAEEIAELQDYWRSILIRLPLKAATNFLMAAALGFTALILAQKSTPYPFLKEFNWLGYLPLAIATVRTIYSLWPWARHIQMIRSDLREMIVLVVRFENETAENTAPKESDPIEILPTSLFVWSRGGKPVFWRLTL